MKILLSAFACGPGLGSEPGVGWNWALALVRDFNHSVTVLTVPRYRAEIEKWQADSPCTHLRFEYLARPDPFAAAGTAGHYASYFLWQVRALRHLRRDDRWRKYDAIHHVTYAGIRGGSLLALLPLPFMAGPLGGGETAPLRLVRGLGRKALAKDALRLMFNAFALIDPGLMLMQRKGQRILAKTRETERLLVYSGDRTLLVNDVGCDGVRRRPMVREGRGGVKLLFAGRLIYWKGVDFLLDAMAILQSEGRSPHLTIVGGGADEGRLRRRIHDEGLKHVDLIGRVPQEHLFSLYEDADGFVFPSLHDSGGTAVIEALSFCLPVICLDRGGPPMLADDAALIVDTVGADRPVLARRLAAAIGALVDDPALRRRLAEAAARRAETLTWRNAVETAYAGFGPVPTSTDGQGRAR